LTKGTKIINGIITYSGMQIGHKEKRIIVMSTDQKTAFLGTSLPEILPYAIASAILYCISVVFYIRNASFQGSWMLYVGNLLFGIGIMGFLISYLRKKKESAYSSYMVLAGHVVTFIGIILSCIISLLLLLIISPGVFHSVTSNTPVLGDSPAQMRDNIHNGLMTGLFMNAVVGNISAGSFLSIVLPNTMRKTERSL
jgi:hypothetical protein